MAKRTKASRVVAPVGPGTGGTPEVIAAIEQGRQGLPGPQTSSVGQPELVRPAVGAAVDSDRATDDEAHAEFVRAFNENLKR